MTESDKPDLSQTTGAADAAPTRAKSRSKRSDPAWRAYTLMLKRKTHSEADIILRRMDNGQDLSDLAQQLFERWVQEHSQS